VRKKNAGALFMDFQISPDDRVGGAQPKSRAAGGAQVSQAAQKPAKGQRIEPGFSAYDDDMTTSPSAAWPRSRQKAPKAKKASSRRAGASASRFSVRRLIGKLFYLGVTLGIWACIAGAGVGLLLRMQMPSADTGRCRSAPPTSASSPPMAS
jgi:penicillin-binding protein 1A